MNNQCPDAEMLQAYVDMALPDAESLAIGQHTATCPTCAALRRQIEKEDAWLSNLLQLDTSQLLQKAAFPVLQFDVAPGRTLSLFLILLGCAAATLLLSMINFDSAAPPWAQWAGPAISAAAFDQLFSMLLSLPFALLSHVFNPGHPAEIVRQLLLICYTGAALVVGYALYTAKSPAVGGLTKNARRNPS